MSAKQQTRDAVVLAAIDLGAHSARMLIAQCGPKPGKISILEDLDVSVPLGANVFHTGEVSASSIQILCDIFRNFREKMKEYAVVKCRAIATSAVREAANAEILIERIRHETGIALKIYEGSDEARLNYLSVRNTLPKRCGFTEKKSMIADIGTGACQISTYDWGGMMFTETLKVGTLRVLELLPGTVSIASLREYLTPVVSKAFAELVHSGADLHGDMLIAMGASVRMLFRIYLMNSGRRTVPPVLRVTEKNFELMRTSIDRLTLEEISSRCDMQQDLAEAVMPCAIILGELFRVTGAHELVIPMISLKQGLMFDFANEILAGTDEFESQTMELVRSIAMKYRGDPDYFTRAESDAVYLFTKLNRLHGLGPRELLLLRIASILHKSGLYLNNQAYHKHSAYIIAATEFPGISLAEREIVAMVARYHRKAEPKSQHIEFQMLPSETKSVILKLSAILRVAIILAVRGISPERIQVRLEHGKVLILSDGTRPFPELVSAETTDLEYFSYVFAVQAILQ